MIIDVDNRFDTEEWWNQSTAIYQTTLKQIKKSWKMSNKGYKPVVPYSVWEKEKLEELCSQNPSQFNEYCAGLVKTADTKMLNNNAIKKSVMLGGLGVLAASVLTGVLPLSLSLGALGLCALCGVNMAIKATGYRSQARHVLSRVWTSSSFNAQKVVFNLRKKDKNQKRVYIKDYSREEFIKSPLYAKLIKRASLPKVVKFQLIASKIDDEHTASSQQPASISRLGALRKWWWQHSGKDKERISIGFTGLVSSARPFRINTESSASTVKSPAELTA